MKQSSKDDFPVDPDFEVCTGCGQEGFVTILGNRDRYDCFKGPYTLCEEAYEDWKVVGDDIVWNHD